MSFPTFNKIHYTFACTCLEIREGSVKVCMIGGSLADADGGQCSSEKNCDTVAVTGKEYLHLIYPFTPPKLYFTVVDF